MSMYKYINSTVQSQYKNKDEYFRNKTTQWRQQDPIVRIENPTNLARARELGYKAKQGVVVVRARIIKGLRKRIKPRGGRKPSKSGRFFTYHKSFQSMAEERVARKYLNCEVVNSYYVGEDGRYKFFEVILADRSHPALVNDKFYGNIIAKKGRAFRALTSSGRKHSVQSRY